MPPNINDAEPYDVRVRSASVPEGEAYWRVSRVHHLTPSENHGLNHLFVDILDAAGRRIYGSRAHVSWDGGSGDPIVDKPANEPGTNFPMFEGGVFAVEALGRPGDTPLPSDRVENIHTNHPAEGEGNAPGHHSFLVVFQRSIAGDSLPPPPPEKSAIHGRIIRGAGRIVALRTGSDHELARKTVDSDETYRFENLAAGNYTVWVVGTNLSQANLQANGVDDLAVPDIELPPSSWAVAITENTSGSVPTNASRSIIVVSVIDQPALPVRLFTSYWTGTVNRTGTKPEYGPFACEFAPLQAGEYTIEPEGLGIRRTVWVDGIGRAQLEFRRLAAGSAEGVISGVLTKGEEHTLILLREGSEVARAPVSSGGRFRFSGLPAGTYRLRVKDTSVVSDDLLLDGSSEVKVSMSMLSASTAAGAIVFGHVVGGAGHVVTLQSQGQTIQQQTVAADDTYRFSGVPSGTYSLAVANSSVTSPEFSIEVNQSLQMDLIFSGSQQQQSAIRGHVAGEQGQPVILERDGQELSRTTPDNDRNFEFSGLPAGVYTVLVENSEAQAGHIVLNGLNQITITLSLTPEERTDSAISGTVRHGGGHILSLQKDGAEVDRTTLESDGQFLFTALGAGTYLLHVIDSNVEQANLVLDGTNRLEVTLELPAEASILHGTVTHGAGFTVVLWRGATEVKRQPVGPDETYRFANLPAGDYRLTIENTTVQATGLHLDGEQQLEVPLVVPVLANDSLLWGVVSGGDQHELVLVEEGAGTEVSRVTLDNTGQFRFEHLAAGTYRLSVEGTSAEVAGLRLDGHNTLQANLEVTSEEPGVEQPSLDHYLLAGPPDQERTRVNLLLLQPFILTFAPTCGFSESEARHAKRVTIVGNRDAVSGEAEQNLTAAGCQVQRLVGTSSHELMDMVRARIESGQPFA
ncbi:MAG: hypothetical protein GXP41_05845 [Chloroflexi bacterium]|nr:hypothetical protein [Chloroflexota bacterium]